MIDGYRLLEIKYRSILSCARHMFSIAITCVEHFIALKEGQKKIEDLDNDIQNYKKEIGKYHKIIMSDSWTNENILINIIISKSQRFTNQSRFKNQFC